MPACLDREGDDHGGNQDVVEMRADGDWDVEESDDAFFALGLLSPVAAGRAAAETVGGEMEDT